MSLLLLFSPGNGFAAQTLLRIVTWYTWARFLEPEIPDLLSLFSSCQLLNVEYNAFGECGGADSSRDELGLMLTHSLALA